jgi:ribosomal protein L37E
VTRHPIRRTKRHWYRVTYEACPVCGRSTVVRQRMYGKRPKVRTRVVDAYDYCDV